ncbi:MAG: peptidoglycan editing factor PgeF [Streptosporangiaceae bacterium]
MSPLGARLVRPTALCPGVSVLVTDRFGGMSTGPFAELNLGYLVGDDPEAVRRNRERALARTGPGVRTLAWMRQVHGARVAYQPADPGQAGQARGAPAGPDARDQEADALFTDAREVALAVQVADCAPVLLADPAAGLIGAAHAGRPGMAAGVVPALVASMRAAGAEPARLHALIGPAICGRCYEVPEQMRSQVAALVPGSACVTSHGTAGIDLRAGLHGQLAALGVTAVRDDARCTAESPELFSYRRDGRTGRFAGLIWFSAG